jgi:hypothetical protein
VRKQKFSCYFQNLYCIIGNKCFLNDNNFVFTWRYFLVDSYSYCSLGFTHIHVIGLKKLRDGVVMCIAYRSPVLEWKKYLCNPVDKLDILYCTFVQSMWEYVMRIDLQKLSAEQIKLFPQCNYVSGKVLSSPQSSRRVAIADFWCTSHRDGKISPGWWGWRVHARPLSAFYHHVQSCSVRSCLGQIHFMYFIATLYVLCGPVIWRGRGFEARINHVCDNFRSAF